MKKTVFENKKFRFASYNIFHGGRADLDMSKIAKNIIDNDIDIVGLQEVDMGALRSGRIDTLKELSLATGYQYYVFFKTIDFDSGEYGTAVLSKYPIIFSEKYLLNSGNSEQRALGLTQIDVCGQIINFFVTHLTFDSPAIRAGQLSQIAHMLSQKDNFVLAGDFNTFDLGALDCMDGVKRINKLEDLKVTFPENKLSIDNILYSETKWRFGDINVVTESYSDHYMIWAEAEYKI